MPAEPDNKMDDALRTYAKKRRDEAGAPLELHPATRKLLQGEAAKLRPASNQKPRTWFNLWLAYWPQLSAAASILVVLAVGYRVLLQEQEAPVTAEQFAKRQAPAAEAESLDRLNRPMPPADSPVKVEGGQEKSGAFRALTSSESQLSPSEARESKDAVAKGGEATIRQLAKAKEDSSKATGGRVGLGEFNQSTALSADKKSVLLTRNEPAIERDALLKQLAPAAPVAPQPSQPRDLSAASSPRRMNAVDSDAQSSPVARTQAGAATVRLADELAASTPAVAGASGPPQTPPQEKAFYRLAGATDGRQFSVAQRQRFIQAPQPTGGLKNSYREMAVQGVLASFEMQQDGMRLRAIDSDGSIYEGQLNEEIDATNGKLAAIAAPALQPSPTPASRPAVGRTSSTSGVDAAKPGPSGARFHLSGTNQTLKQLVVFEGLLTGSTTTSSPAPLGSVTALPTANQRQQPPPDAYSLQQLRLLAAPIQGTLRIGTSNAVPVQALPVSR